MDFNQTFHTVEWFECGIAPIHETAAKNYEKKINKFNPKSCLEIKNDLSRYLRRNNFDK